MTDLRLPSFVILPTLSKAGAIAYSVQYHQPTLEEMQKVVGGFIEVVPIHTGTHERCYLVINEEGKLKGLPKNEAATFIAGVNLHPGDYIAGNAIFIGSDDTGELAPLPRHIATKVAQGWEEDGPVHDVAVRDGVARVLETDGNVH